MSHTKKKYSITIAVSIVVLLALIFFEPAYGWHVRQWLSESGNTMTPMQTQADQANLAAQNEALQAQLSELQDIAAQIPQDSQGNIRAMVYAQYPFGFKNEVLVNAGSDSGVISGKAVTFQGVFIGTVTQVFPKSAIVQTVFDPGFKMPVRIGSRGVDGLLVGGAYPKADSIAKSASIEVGDVIYTDAPGLVYGLPVGVVNATDTSADNLFQEASLNFAYDINMVQTVLIEK